MRTAIKTRRQLGLFDATMIVMGGIVGAGIFANPSEVAHRVHTPFLILGVWVVGGLFAMFVPPEHPPVNDLIVTKSSYEVRLAEPLDPAYARRKTGELLTALKRLEERADGRLGDVHRLQL